MNTTWTEKRMWRLADMWLDGKPASIIAKDLDLTKNAIIGMAHRLELPGRESPIIRGRLPDNEESSRFERFEGSLEALCRILFNSNEFLYVE